MFQVNSGDFWANRNCWNSLGVHVEFRFLAIWSLMFENSSGADVTHNITLPLFFQGSFIPFTEKTLNIQLNKTE